MKSSRVCRGILSPLYARHLIRYYARIGVFSYGTDLTCLGIEFSNMNKNVFRARLCSQERHYRLQFMINTECAAKGLAALDMCDSSRQIYIPAVFPMISKTGNSIFFDSIKYAWRVRGSDFIIVFYDLLRIIDLTTIGPTHENDRIDWIYLDKACFSTMYLGEMLLLPHFDRLDRMKLENLGVELPLLQSVLVSVLAFL
jgi:hypothetical protein